MQILIIKLLESHGDWDTSHQMNGSLNRVQVRYPAKWERQFFIHLIFVYFSLS